MHDSSTSQNTIYLFFTPFSGQLIEQKKSNIRNPTTMQTPKSTCYPSKLLLVDLGGWLANADSIAVITGVGGASMKTSYVRTFSKCFRASTYPGVQALQPTWTCWVKATVASSLESSPVAVALELVREIRLLMLRIPVVPQGDQTMAVVSTVSCFV